MIYETGRCDTRKGRHKEEDRNGRKVQKKWTEEDARVSEGR